MKNVQYIHMHTVRLQELTNTKVTLCSILSFYVCMCLYIYIFIYIYLYIYIYIYV